MYQSEVLSRNVGGRTSRLSPSAAALADHGRICAACTAAARAGKSYRSLCVVGRLLAECALKARARRAS